MSSLLTRIKLMGLLCALGLAVGCAGSQQDEEELQAEEGGQQESQQSADEAMAQEEPVEEPEEVVEAEPEPEPEPVAVVEPEPEPVPEPAKAVPTTGAPSAKRVVRYVNKDGAEIFSAMEGGSAVGKLRKGDRILVIEENGWGRISDSMFIKLDHLSSKAVARERKKARWGKPAH